MDYFLKAFGDANLGKNAKGKKNRRKLQRFFTVLASPVQ
jgi:hypothetical protein